MSTSHIGTATSRIDGVAKVTGRATYAAEFHEPGILYGSVVSAAIAKGRIRRIDARDALSLSGVIEIFTHENRVKLARSDESYQDDVAPDGSPFRPLYDNKIRFSGQPVALVIADDFDVARYAASLVRIDYERDEPIVDLDRQRQFAYEPKRPTPPRGNAEAAFRTAEVKFDGEYRTPIEHHNPIEIHASTVVWQPDGKLVVYDKTQGVQNVERYLEHVFGMQDLRVISPYVGGAFGSGLRPQYQLTLAVMAARALRRSVRVSLTRQQMFALGYRPQTVQRVALGARSDGTLLSVMHDALSITSRFEDFTENLVGWWAQLYRCDNTKFTHKLVKLDLNTPADMRAPGGATGVYAIECAMDELAHRLQINPLELRLRNYSEKDQKRDKPFSSKQLRECYRAGADRFGWAKRTPNPRSMRDGKELVGWGMATGIWEAMQQEASARATLTADGRLTVASATSDIGTGTYTMMAQVAAERLGLPVEQVAVELGDSALPKSPVEGGSWTAASIGTAVHEACRAVREEVLNLARKLSNSAVVQAHAEDVIFADGKLWPRDHPADAIAITDVMRRSGVDRIEKEATGKPPSEEERSFYTHSAIFAEVKIDEQLGVIRVTRVVNAVAAGRIINPKTARSQILGGVVWGIGMALEEETMFDSDLGRPVNANLGEYHVPVNADINSIDVIFVDERDDTINPLGVKGVGEIGVVGTAAAIANAIFHATGRRIRDLPITLDRLLI